MGSGWMFDGMSRSDLSTIKATASALPQIFLNASIRCGMSQRISCMAYTMLPSDIYWYQVVEELTIDRHASGNTCMGLSCWVVCMPLRQHRIEQNNANGWIEEQRGNLCLSTSTILLFKTAVSVRADRTYLFPIIYSTHVISPISLMAPFECDIMNT